MATLDDTPPQGSAAYRQLLAQIKMGDLAPGDRLREEDLAVRLGVSRTPIREAIRQLEADGLVVHAPRQGAVIRSLDYTEAMELYEMRAVLEGMAARLAARAASEIELEELTSVNEALAAAGPGSMATHLNRVFHATLLDAAKNRFLHRSVSTLRKAMMILGPSMLMDRARADAAVAEHRQVLAALRTRDGAGAEAAMRAHIEASQRLRIRKMQGRQ
ncbi:MAG: GntR family transcriptional regulator [Pseudomonadota bacterium]